jgi:rhodanese-related sulfurtransferase
MEKATVIIDVRTPEEFADGHLEGAINIDIYNPAFQDSIAALETNGVYVVYCRSGHRSGHALMMMNAMGIDDVTNLGGLGDATASTGIPIVT